MNTSKIVRNFIVLEGLDGAGTTTQGTLLHQRFLQEGITSILTQEPTKMPIGRLIRSFLKKEYTAAPSTMAHLFASDRNEHLYGPGGILEETAKGSMVISDRYLFSSLAYQSVDCDPAFVEGLNSRFPLPEILIYIDVHPEVGEKRLVSRAEREIYEFEEFQSRVLTNYLRILEEYSGTRMRILRIDGDRSPDWIHDGIWSFIQNFR